MKAADRSLQANERLPGFALRGGNTARREPLALLAALVFAYFACPHDAHAQMISLSPQAAPALGSTIRGSAATTFSISPTGAVTRTSGNAIRMTSAGVTAPSVNFNCGLLNLSQLCLLRPVRVTIAPASAGGPATISRFRISSLSGTTYVSGSPPAEASVLVFDLKPLGLLSTVSFKLGMDVLLAANADPGPSSYSYTVTAVFL